MRYFLKNEKEGTVPLNRHTDYQKLERRVDRKKKKHSWVSKGGYTSNIIIPATPNSELANDMRKVCEGIAKMDRHKGPHLGPPYSLSHLCLGLAALST